MSVKHIPYIGSGPYCYSNSLAMLLGKDAPSTAVIEFATSSPFGMQMVGDTPFFEPYGWTPIAGFEQAIKTMGWESTQVISKDGNEALARLREKLEKGPVFVGPVEMGNLRYHPNMDGPIGADHYVVVLGVQGDEVEIHDPEGYPYATLPLSDFMEAWSADKITYGKPYMMRTDFRRVEAVSEEDVIQRSITAGARWLRMVGEHETPPGSVGNREAAERLAALVEAGCDAKLRGHLIYFAVRVGTRRAADAATCLSRVGFDNAAEILARQARLIGSLQYSLVVEDTSRAAAALRALASTYMQLITVL